MKVVENTTSSHVWLTPFRRPKVRPRGKLGIAQTLLCRAPSAQFFANDAAKCLFKRRCPALNVLAKRGIHHRLVISATGRIDLFTKPFENVVIDPYRNASLPFRWRNNRSTLGLAKFGRLLHGRLLSYAARCRAVAFRA